MKRTGIFAAFAVVALFLTACGVNSIPTAEENAKEKWANVQAAYQRRLDVLPTLVAATRASGAHENSLQIGVAQARSAASAASAARVSPDQLTDAAAMQRFAQAQQGVSNLIIQATQEAPPENRANENWATLLREVEGTNNRITVAIRDYNEAVRAYNTRIRTFPSVIGARVIYGSRPLVPYAATAGAERAPTLDFGNGQ